MSISIRLKRGTAAELDQLTLPSGSIAISSQDHSLRVHDGTTQGGVVVNVKQALIDLESQVESAAIGDVGNLQQELDSLAESSELGLSIATLNPQGVVPTEQLPSYVEDIIEVADVPSLPSTGEVGKLYVTTDLNEMYRWSGTQQSWYQVGISVEDADDLSEGQTNFYFTEARVRDSFGASGGVVYDTETGVFSFSEAIHSVSGRTGNVVVNKADITLGSVEDYAPATEAEASVLTSQTAYLTPQAMRDAMIGLGFVDSDGWSFEGATLPALRIGSNLTVLADRPVTSKRHTLSYANGYLWLFGGQYDNSPAGAMANLYRYDLATDTWTAMSSAPRERMSHSACVVGDVIYIVGGNSGQVSEHYGEIMSYNTNTDTWTDLTPIPGKVNTYNQSPSICKDGKIYSFGVNTSDGYDTWIYDIATDTWGAANTTINANLTVPFGDAVNVGDKTYLVTYASSSSNNLLIHTYDHNTNTLDGPVNTDTVTYAEEEGAVEYLDGKLILSVGSPGFGAIVEYDINSDTWNDIVTYSDSNLVYDDTQHDIVLVESDLYVARGGSTTSGTMTLRDFYKLT